MTRKIGLNYRKKQQKILIKKLLMKMKLRLKEDKNGGQTNGRPQGQTQSSEDWRIRAASGKELPEDLWSPGPRTRRW
jgi:hypothetical protein